MKRLIYVAGVALTLAIGGCKKETASNNGAPAPTPGQKVGNAVDSTTREAVKAKNTIVSEVAPSGSADLSGMRGALEGVVENALGKDDFKSMAGHFTSADEQRITASQLNLQPLNDQIQKFKTGWKAKYNDNFAVMDADKIYAADYATLSSSASSNAAAKTGTATLKATGNLPELKVPLVAENGKWRVDVPDTLDAATLEQNIQHAIEDVNSHTDQWPTDKVQAYRWVSQRVLQAIVTGH